jgi:hypothetical protein
MFPGGLIWLKHPHHIPPSNKYNPLRPKAVENKSNMLSCPQDSGPSGCDWYCDGPALTDHTTYSGRDIKFLAIPTAAGDIFTRRILPTLKNIIAKSQPIQFLNLLVDINLYLDLTPVGAVYQFTYLFFVQATPLGPVAF